MGVLKSLILISLLGCTPSGGAAIVDNAERTVEYVSRSTASVIEQSRESSVEILSYDSEGGQIGGSGAYVRYKNNYFILTAAHVVAESSMAMVSHGDEKIIAKVLYFNHETDLAILGIEGMFTREPLMWRTADPAIGDEVVYTGYPNGYPSLHSYAWSGASGSAVLDRKGRIVGVLSAVDIGYAFGAIPQIVEDVVIVVPIHRLKIEDLLLSLSN
mgnify:CR=1 FL=1